MTGNPAPRARYREAFWRAHHEAWKRSGLNQREYCEAQEISFKAEPQPPERKLLYRRGGVSHSPSHTLSHMTYPASAPSPDLIVPPPRAGHRRRFCAADRQKILDEMAEPGRSLSEVARRYGIAPCVICRWRQGLAAAKPTSVEVEITDRPAAGEGAAS